MLGPKRSFPGEPSLPGLEMREVQTGRASEESSQDDRHSFNEYRVVGFDPSVAGSFMYCALSSGATTV